MIGFVTGHPHIIKDNNMEQVNGSTLSEKLNSEKLVLVDCYADWCMPCKMLKPTIEKLSESESTRLDVYALDISDNPEAAAQYNVRSIPTLLWFKGGNLVATDVGMKQEAYLKERVEELSR